MDNISDKPQAIELKVFCDDRGVFVPVMDELQNLDPKIGRIERIYYVANPTRGVIRGFHYHKKEWKFFTIVKGSAKFVAVDPDKPEVIYSFIGSDRKANLINIPPGYANGWVSLEDGTVLLCASTADTKGSIADDKRFDPFKFGDVWTVKGR